MLASSGGKTSIFRNCSSCHRKRDAKSDKQPAKELDHNTVKASSRKAALDPALSPFKPSDRLATSRWSWCSTKGVAKFAGSMLIDQPNLATSSILRRDASPSPRRRRRASWHRCWPKRASDREATDQIRTTNLEKLRWLRSSQSASRSRLKVLGLGLSSSWLNLASLQALSVLSLARSAPGADRSTTTAAHHWSCCSHMVLKAL